MSASSDRAPATNCHTHVVLDAAFDLPGWLPCASSAQDLLELLAAGCLDRAAVAAPNALIDAEYRYPAFAMEAVYAEIGESYPWCFNSPLTRSMGFR